MVAQLRLPRLPYAVPHPRQPGHSDDGSGNQRARGASQVRILYRLTLWSRDTYSYYLYGLYKTCAIKFVAHVNQYVFLLLSDMQRNGHLACWITNA